MNDYTSDLNTAEMPLTKLPRELLYDIASHLDYGELCSCALTCRALVAPAQAGIFSEMGSIWCEAKAEQAARKLESFPHLASYIKHLQVWDIHKPWFRDSKAFLRLAASLSPSILQSLHIRQRRSSQRHPRFPFSLSLAKLEFLTEISLSEELHHQELPLKGDYTLPDFLNSFPQLRVLTLDQCYVRNTRLVKNNGVSVEPFVSTPCFRLEKLTVGGCMDTLVLEWIVPALSSLRSLSISYPSDTTSFAPMHIAAAGKALQELTILLGSDGDLTPLTNAINMHATNLRSFRMDAYDVERAVQILSLLDGKRALQDLTISLLMDKGDVERGPWDKLQDILINQDRFTALECLELSFIPDSSRIPFSTATVLAALPELVRKKILYVTTTGYNA